jgi:2,3-bisphosphoglycerate-dependent phosphoglycerate mutase
MLTLATCLLLLIGFFSSPEPGVPAPPTVVYLIRHAEKVTDNPDDRDPLLTEAGKQRAEALNTYLAGERIEGLFATPYQRTQLTLAPLAKARNLSVQTYDSKNHAALVEKIKQEYAGKTVVVAGHSNSVLELIEAFGLERPISQIEEHEYTYIFRLVLGPGKPGVTVAQYGEVGRLSN